MWWLLPAVLAVQTPDPIRLLAPDSGRAISRARAALEAFESDRHRKLPVRPAATGRCDERIGRFCYWYDEGDTSLPKEPEGVKTTRARLNAGLARAQTDHPTSNWLIGQRVRYLLEHQQSDSGLAVAARCGAASWWCGALAGLALHLAERFASADSAFDVALTAMPAGLRCAWTDWTVVLESEAAAKNKSLDCDGRRRFADSLFLLAKPLLSLPGNDVRTELLSRRTMAALHTFARSPHFIPWGKDMEELMLRYGWSTAWSVNDPSMISLAPSGVTGHQRSPAYQFFPARNADQSWRWNLEPDRARFRYAPTYADRFLLVDNAQIARFPRGDSTIVVAGSIGPPDAIVALTAIGQSLNDVATARTDSAAPVGGLLVRLAGKPTIASLESRRYRQVATARLVFDPEEPTGPLILSDPLFFSVDDELPESLEGATARALATTQISRETPVGIYWEATGKTHDSLDVAVSITPIRRGFPGRIGEGLLTLRWQASGGAFELDLRRQKPGRYLLRLEARAGGTTATSQRAFTLMP